MGVLSDLIRQLREKASAAERPDHEPYIRADYAMCCAWHEEHAFWVDPQATAQWHEH
jgi:hypothetical protein